jgi:hypothetical protein
LEGQVKDAALGEDVKKILTNRIRNLNATPQSMLTTNLMKSLGLALGPREEKATIATYLTVSNFKAERGR